ncbi:raffinose synthase Sip1 [Cordyceps militaris CM01]|uniref:Raffinose synthase Sip1 n=1 Tax=Cordyceps militaris (strain CM01) TaxID=983644 RepID=G3JJN1_CORMM|nr:raffinose synthase Sip1 [Cordyceps militaris CM01]EGX91271.1 raffinose synthase Sip1 [Cordyceps militaris CM01]
MQIRVHTLPRLGDVTVVKTKKQCITAVLEVPNHFANQDWQVSLWHSTDGSEWTALQLPAVIRQAEAVDLRLSPSHSHLHFQTELSFHTSLRFTIKFRHASDELWIWVKQEYGLEDGHVLLEDNEAASQKIEDLIPNLGSEWLASSLQSQAPDTKLWSLTTKIRPSLEDRSSFKDVEIGTPFTHFQKWFALVRTSVPWIAPRKGLSRFSLDKEAILCSFANEKGRHLVFLAVSGVDDILALFRSTGSNSIAVHARNDAPVERDLTVLVSTGYNADKAMASVIYHARSLIWKYSPIGTQQPPPNNINDLKPQWREYWYDGLGYCTWNSLGQDLTEDKILDALEKLEESGIGISNLIIDDNWQSIDATNPGDAQPGWLDFEANPAGFPNGLRGAVSKIRRTHRTIEHIFVWHALMGYWGGISPRGTIAQTYETTRVGREDTGTDMTVIAAPSLSRFYDDFYSFLIRSGVDGVKTDAQCMLDAVAGAPARRTLTNAYLDTWSVASLRHFGTNTIACMAQFPQALFHALLPRRRPAVVARTSDDYVPDGAAAAHRWHVWANAHNGLLAQYLNVVPDWDMFQTAHPLAEFHAAARCLSGGPLYITDVPGHHDVALLNRCTALTTLGKTIVLRPSVVGIALNPYQDYDSGALLKIGSFHGSGSGGISIMGVFQTSDARHPSLTLLSEFRGTSTAAAYVVRAYTSGRVSPILRFADDGQHGPSLLATPGRHGYELYTAYELTSCASRRFGQVSVASLGLVDKMTGGAAIEASHVEAGGARVTVVTKLRALGIFGVYISSLASLTVDDNFMVTIFGHPVPRHTVRVSSSADTVLEVDVEAAWKELGLDSGWSNELEVTVNILRM